MARQSTQGSTQRKPSRQSKRGERGEHSKRGEHSEHSRHGEKGKRRQQSGQSKSGARREKRPTMQDSSGSKPLVGILAGSPSDLEVVSEAQEVLNDLQIPSELKVLSAHRTPDLVQQYVVSAAERGIEVLIACAGMANHLGGAVAAHTILPVIGVPLASGALRGFDALLSTVQMPPGVPVATVGIDGTKNAAYLAARILAVGRPDIAGRLQQDRQRQRARYETGN